MERNITLIPWFLFFKNLVFWQAIWFLYLQREVSAAEAILLYAIYDVAATALEVPSGYFSDKVGRRVTLLASALFAVGSGALQTIGGDFWLFAAAQVLLGAAMAFVSGTTNALMFESLAATGREDELDTQELRSWRFTFFGLAGAALIGGALAYWDFKWAYAATTLAFAAAFVVAINLHDAPKRAPKTRQTDLQAIAASFRNPALLWLFAFAMLTYGYSHLPFVFGQPFILDALAPLGLAAETPLISGAIVTAMMLLSLLASLAVPFVRAQLGLGQILVAALALQVAITAALTLVQNAAVILVLLLRMVPSAFISALMMAKVQTLVSDQMRATYVSLQSLIGRLVFAAGLALAAGGTPDTNQMARADIQSILGWYALAGAGFVILLALALPKARLGGPQPDP